MSNYNNVNTGLAHKVDQFRLSASFDDKPHVVGVFKTAPDYSIPPTPASSYANIHVILDTVHQSSITRSTHTQMQLPQYNVGTQSRSFSDLPKPQESFLERAVPAVIDPEQPGARSDPALTSLKSEIAPMTPGFVDLEPETVDIGLVDETFARDSRRKWALMEEEERSWRMSRNVDQAWLRNWRKVGEQLLHPWAVQEEEERLWRLRGGVDASWTQKWREVGNELKGISASLWEQERSWRISRTLDSTWSSNIKAVNSEVRMLNFDFGDLTSWVNKLKTDIESQSAQILRATEITVHDLADASEKYLDELEHQPTLSWAQLAELEDGERDFRASLGHNAILSGKWHRVGLELQSLVGTSWSEWLVSIKNKAVREVKSDYRALKHVELPEVKLPSFRNIQLPQVSLPNITLPNISLPDITLPDLKLGVVKSEVTTPMWDDNMPVDFTFKSSRFSHQYVEAEEQERADRIARGINPVVAGKWYRLGLELKYRYALRPTFANAARSLVNEAEYYAEKATEKAVDLIGTFAETAYDAVESMEQSILPASHPDFKQNGRSHLNFFAYTAEPIDFTFRSSRTPKSVIALEERERRERIRNGPNRALLSQWQRVLNGGLPSKVMAGASVETLGQTMVHAKDAFVEKTSEYLWGAEKYAASAIPTGLSGFFHRVAVGTSSLVESAKETLHISEPSASSMKAEELERTRRLSAKVDPLTAARLGRVQDELLSFTVKSV